MEFKLQKFNRIITPEEQLVRFLLAAKIWGGHMVKSESN